MDVSRRFLTFTKQHKSSRARPLAHASRDAFAKLGELYRPRVMGGCLQGGGAYKLLREQERRIRRGKRKTEKRSCAGEEARGSGKITSLSSQDILGYSATGEGDPRFRGKNTSGYLRDKVQQRTKRFCVYNPPLSYPLARPPGMRGYIHMK